MSKTWTRKRVRQKKKSSRDHNIAQVQLVGSSKWCNKQIRISIPSQESQIGRVWCSCGSQNWGGNKATKLDISSSKLTQLIIAIFIAIYFWVIFNLSTHAGPFSRRCCHFRKSVHGGPPERYMHTTPVIDQRQAKHSGGHKWTINTRSLKTFAAGLQFDNSSNWTKRWQRFYNKPDLVWPFDLQLKRASSSVQNRH